MAQSEVDETVIALFRARRDIPGMHRERLLLLTTTGARTGAPHTTPMMFHREGGMLMVIASNNGAASDPHWVHNLRANPTVRVEIGDDDYAATAAELDARQRPGLWDRITRLYPFFAEHQGRTARQIPVVALERTG